MQVELQAKSPAAVTLLGPDWLLIHNGQGLMATVSMLSPGCSYLVRVRACNDAGYGQFSVPAEVASSPGIPEASAAPSATNVAARSMLVNWQPPFHDGGSAIKLYRCATANNTLQMITLCGLRR